MSKRQPELLVEDIIESSNKILMYTEGLTFDQFTSDSKTADAVIRNFEVIGDSFKANEFCGVLDKGDEIISAAQ